ncbi:MULTISPECIES: ABC transporter ATP-binding protein [unclassified Paenibacillus]|uniref:energy-coupling factor ABC transporter ATP-binding protein n=1 Tax=unclassified Paenibacillus TaxID=185978 RepID=UPI001AE6EFD9|nr:MULTISPECIES: ABC transporter ATP-binding protein [unclassified Paenibacillus]MBP1155560.1 energy-coupling factor transport system ATP-binding protein [Paenibacillus sp. PvP091]MBP1169054.1 energy-coupling factor transport system ATP-binding protein [Paenibacillus sp. PvR098]MBP2440082.1 energy-coupling factor transport system ATP-binding protein [Paenibacillus sp. PvP052]
MIYITPSVLKLEQVTVHYMGDLSRLPALQQVSLELPKGSWTAVVGDNGSGKSTLSKVLAGLSPVSEGQRIVTEGHTVHMVLQNPETQILGETIYEEIDLSMPESYDRSQEDKEAHMLDLLNEVRLSAPLDAPVQPLSGGQKQLLNMACCLAAGADSILFDEATSMLDPSSRKAVLETTAKLHRSGHTIVWVTHRMEELCYAERVLLLDQGRVAFDGTSELFFYGEGHPDLPSPCEQFGFDPPDVVRVVRALLKLGHELPIRPLFPQQLSQAVRSLCQ